MSKLYLSLSLMALSVCTACGIIGGGGGGGGNTGGFGGGGTSGSFSTASLSGTYAYRITGYDLGTTGQAIPFVEAGSFVADGKGNISGGEDDFAEGTGTFHDTVLGSYSVSSDGTGNAALQLSGGAIVQVGLTIVNSSSAYLAVAPSSTSANVFLGNGTGTATLQTSSALTTLPSGTFVFRTHDVASDSTAAVGVFTIAGGVVTSGNEDVLRNSRESSLAISGGLFNAPDASGRGTGTLVDSQTTSTFAYYVVDSTHLILFSTATGNIGLGQAQAQTGTFSNTSLAGSYAFGSRGDDNTFAGGFLGGTNTVGQFTASSGTISAGQFDSAIDGAVTTGTLTGTYTVAANGRAVVNLTPSTGAAFQHIYWMVSPSRAFFLTNDATKVEDGSADLQQSGAFSKSSVNGQFGFGMDGVISATNGASLYDRVGYIHWDGAGNMGLNEFLNVNGSGTLSGILNGTYTVAANGRAVGNINTLSSNLVFYLVSGNQAYMLQADTGAEINGMMGQQP